MSLFVEHPAQLCKSRLKSDLVAHNVPLPPAKSRKEVYVELHLKHIDQKKAADFSSDEEEDAADKQDDAQMPDPSVLTDDDLKAALLEHGVKAGPIVGSTRALYEKKLRKLLQPDGQCRLNGLEKDVLYSDSEDEEEEEEEEESREEEDKESDSQEAKEERVEQSHQAQQESKQVDFQKGGFVYPQCFLPSSRLIPYKHVPASRDREPRHPKWNSGNVIKSVERSQPRCSQIPAGINRASSVEQHSGLGSGVPPGSRSVIPNGNPSISSPGFSITQMMESLKSLSPLTVAERELNGNNVQENWSRSNGLDVPIVDNYTVTNQSLYYSPKASPYEWKMKEPVKDTFKDMVPKANATLTGIYATRRRPIKGAAGRPVQYAYPDCPASPTTLERQQVERRLVPIHIQILVFIIVTFLLYLIYACVEDNSFSPFVAFLDSLNQGPDSEEELLLQAETQDTPALSGQE